MDKLEREVIAIVSQITKTPEESLRMDTDLRVELNVDSLQGLQIVAAVESRYGVTVPDDQIDIYTSPSTIAEAIRRLSGEAQGL